MKGLSILSCTSLNQGGEVEANVQRCLIAKQWGMQKLLNKTSHALGQEKKKLKQSFKAAHRCVLFNAEGCLQCCDFPRKVNPDE